jgi:hypothetical protein
MFVAAMRGGDVTGWMGEKGVEIIKSSRRAEAFARIAGDFIANARRADDTTPPGEWKSLTLPMLYGHELSRIHLHYRSFERDGDDKTPDRKTGTRFVLDLSLTRMGPLQIDGFSIGKKLDVTLRSEQPLSPQMREAMRTRYHDAVTGIGFAGTLNFSNDIAHKGWVATDHQPAPQEARFI